MKKQFLLIFAITIMSLVLAGMALATAGYSLPWWTVDSGGGASLGGDYTLSGTIGQPDAAVSKGGDYTLSGGFWSGPGPAGEITHKVLLPIIMKQ